MVNALDKFNEVAIAVALYKMSLICYFFGSLQGQYCQMNKHQFHSHNTTANKRLLKLQGQDAQTFCGRIFTPQNDKIHVSQLISSIYSSQTCTGVYIVALL